MYNNQNTEIQNEDCFISSRNNFLKTLFPEFPQNHFDKLEISIIINNAPNAYLLYSILDLLPTNNKAIDKQNINVFVVSKNEFIKFAALLFDIISIAKQWKYFNIYFNGINITLTQLHYISNFYFELENKPDPYSCSQSIHVLKRKYNPSVKRKNALSEIPVTNLLGCDNKKILSTIVAEYINQFATKFKTDILHISDNEIILTIEDELVISFYMTHLTMQELLRNENTASDNNWKNIIIQELSYNHLYKFVFSKFKSSFYSDQLELNFLKFKGINTYTKEIDRFHIVAQNHPELKLKERFESYAGELYHFIIFEIESPSGEIQYGIGYTKNKIHGFVLKICKELEEKNSKTLEYNGSSSLPFNENKEFIKTFLSWKGKKKRWRLENKFSYYNIDILIKEAITLYTLPKQLLLEAKSGKHQHYERGKYKKPINRWKTEETLYHLINEIFGDYQVIYQHRPFFLRSASGQLSYDIYICGLRIAIEYQGKQHFEPVEYFGGQENYSKQIERDKLKIKLSKENNICLIHINYWEDITPDHIRNKIEQEYEKYKNTTN